MSLAVHQDDLVSSSASQLLHTLLLKDNQHFGEMIIVLQQPFNEITNTKLSFYEVLASRYLSVSLETRINYCMLVLQFDCNIIHQFFQAFPYDRDIFPHRNINTILNLRIIRAMIRNSNFSQYFPIFIQFIKEIIPRNNPKEMALSMWILRELLDHGLNPNIILEFSDFISFWIRQPNDRHILKIIAGAISILQFLYCIPNFNPNMENFFPFIFMHITDIPSSHTTLRTTEICEKMIDRNPQIVSIFSQPLCSWGISTLEMSPAQFLFSWFHLALSSQKEAIVHFLCKVSLFCDSGVLFQMMNDGLIIHLSEVIFNLPPEKLITVIQAVLRMVSIFQQNFIDRSRDLILQIKELYESDTDLQDLLTDFPGLSDQIETLIK